MRLTFLKLPEIRRFNPIPRYYDEDKERLQQLIANAKKEKGISEDQPLDIENKNKVYSSNIRGQFTSMRRKKTNRDVVTSGRRKSNIRVLIIVAFLIIIFYLGYAKSMEMAMLILK